MAKTQIEILNSSQERIAIVKSAPKINERGTILRYSKELSDYGKCTFRIATDDPMWSALGNVVEPFKYGVQIRRGQEVVWRGIIINNTQRTKNFIEIEASQYLFLLDRILVKRDAETVTGDGLNNYRTFDSGTMKAAVEAMITEVAAAADSGSLLNSISAGTVENPNYPANFIDSSGSQMTGGWTFSSDITLQFDYRSVLFVLQAFGIYSNSDFQLNDDLTLDFQKYIGNKERGLTFKYGTFGNIVDYNLPLIGSRMANRIVGIAATYDGTLLHVTKENTKSIQDYGALEDVAAFVDVKDKNSLRARIAEELRFTKQPDNVMNVILDEKAYPLGQYDIGDTVTFDISDGIISVKEPRRIVGITVELHNTGRETITLQTNKPRQEQE